MRTELLRHFGREVLVEPQLHIDRCQLAQLGLSTPRQLLLLSCDVRPSASRCELTETYSPIAIDIAPATSPATPATRAVSGDAEDARTPMIRLAVDTMASSDPSTGARIASGRSGDSLHATGNRDSLFRPT